jgi:hypothetical protein
MGPSLRVYCAFLWRRHMTTARELARHPGAHRGASEPAAQRQRAVAESVRCYTFTSFSSIGLSTPCLPRILKRI